MQRKRTHHSCLGWRRLKRVTRTGENLSLRDASALERERRRPGPREGHHGGCDHRIASGHLLRIGSVRQRRRRRRRQRDRRRARQARPGGEAAVRWSGGEERRRLMPLPQVVLYDSTSSTAPKTSFRSAQARRFLTGRADAPSSSVCPRAVPSLFAPRPPALPLSSCLPLALGSDVQASAAKAAPWPSRSLS